MDRGRMKPKLKHPNEAPKDGTLILAMIGWPWLVPAMWCESSDKWVVAESQMVGMEDGTHDRYFENAWESHESLTGWIPLPDVE
jgi:hypothetical protein